MFSNSIISKVFFLYQEKVLKYKVKLCLKFNKLTSSFKFKLVFLRIKNFFVFLTVQL